MVDLLKEYKAIINKYSDIPNVYIDASCYHIVSTCWGRFFEFPDLKISRPNTWFILSSIPGRMRRSTIVNYTNKVVNDALYSYYKMKKVEDEEISKKISLSQIEDGTAPGIADAIIEGFKNDVTQFSIVSTEIGDILRKINNSGTYSIGVDTLLSKLYYGESYNQRLSQRQGEQSRNIPPGAYVTMFSSMQEPSIYLNEGMSRQGLLRRIKIIYQKTKDLSMDNWKPPHMKGYKHIWAELHNFAEKKIAPLMFAYDKDELQSIIQNEEVNEYITSKANESDNALLEEESNYNIYQQTQWEYEIKLGALDALTKGSTKITIDNINNIQPFLNDTNKNIEETINLLSLDETKQKDEKIYERVKYLINNGGKHGVTVSTILQGLSSYKIHSRELRNKYLIELLGDNSIKQIIIKDSLGRDQERWIMMKYDYNL